MLVGRGASGKTSIARRLIKGTFSRRVKETQGIDIAEWKVRCGDADIHVHLWDFAGQVITHAAHQFFMSERSVYVLVITGREDTQRIDADYWLRLIRAFANESPVIIALNKWDEHPFKLDRNLLREKYPSIVDFVETDCKSGRGIAELKTMIAATIDRLDYVHQPFARSWWRVKQRLERQRRPYLPYGDFQKLCAKEKETDPDRQRILADVFHALGIALNYGRDERLRSATILNPHWVTEGIYKLLRQAVADDGSAELTHARVAEVLPKEPPHMQRYLVDLMRRFDLAFPLDESGERWLVPQRLPAEQPVLEPKWQSEDATRLRYRYPVVPEGLLPRLITRTYPLSDAVDANGAPQPRWANGVVLADEGAEALIRVNHEEREIQIVVIGPQEARLSLLGVIKSDFRTIHGDIAGLDQVEEVEISGQAGSYLSVQTLEVDEAKGQPSSIPTAAGTVMLNATDQLNRLSAPEARDKRLWRARVFISYCSVDARFKDELMVRLKPMRESHGLIDWWYDRCIPPGDDWDGEIRAELERADVILMLVSSRFLASTYIGEVEMKRAIQRAVSGNARLIPIILEKCPWQESMGRFNALPRKGKPVRDTKPQRHAWHAIDEELRREVRRMRAEQEARDIDDLYRRSSP